MDRVLGLFVDGIGAAAATSGVLSQAQGRIFGLLYLTFGSPLARAVEIRSNVPVFQNNFATALERSGHFTSAVQAYEAALEADSTYSKAAVGLERVRAHAGGSDTTAVDAGELSREFQQQVEEWRARGAAADSTSDSGTVSPGADSTSAHVGDTILQSEPVPDSVTR